MARTDSPPIDWHCFSYLTAEFRYQSLQGAQIPRRIQISYRLFEFVPLKQLRIADLGAATEPECFAAIKGEVVVIRSQCSQAYLHCDGNSLVQENHVRRKFSLLFGGKSERAGSGDFCDSVHGPQECSGFKSQIRHKLIFDFILQ